MDMVMDIMDTMVRGQLRQGQDMDTMDMVMVMVMVMAMAMDTMDTMARGLLMLKLSQLPLLSQAMDIMVMVMVTILDMVMATMDTMAKDLLKQSLDMDTMVMVMDMGMAMDMDMAIMDTMARDLPTLSLVMDTMDKQQPNLEFSTNEVGKNLSLVKETLIHVEINFIPRRGVKNMETLK